MALYSGADWLQRQGLSLSPLGVDVANILGQAWRGIYHIDKAVLHKRCQWDNRSSIEVVTSGCLSSYDSGTLTDLLLLCHAMCVRLEISGASNGYLRLRFSPRDTRDITAPFYRRHPTIERAIAESKSLVDDCIAETVADSTKGT